MNRERKEAQEDSFYRLRKEYGALSFDESQAAASPYQQFKIWFDQARKAALFEPNAMQLATCGEEGPALRSVLLKEYDERGFVFYTNYASPKGRQIEHCARVALLFLWQELERQVRIEGRAEKLSAEENSIYFASRPRLAQIAALISAQSQIVAGGRKAMEQRYQQADEDFAGQEIPCPANWGGYRISADYFEFWQGREGRLHDRICYQKNKNPPWQISRLWP